MAAQSPHLGADYDLPRADLAFRDGVPFAPAFDDGYYNADDGLAESRHVFLDGNGLFARMREMGLFENTWIIFTTDHGDMLGDHHMGAKAIFLEGSAHIPLLVKPPHGYKSELKGTCCDSLVNLADIMPTILNLTGTEGADKLDGTDLMQVYEKQTPERTFYGNCNDNCFAVIDGQYKYTWTPLGDGELMFNPEKDPQEQRNLTDSPASADKLDELRKMLFDFLKDKNSQWIKDGKKISVPGPKGPADVNKWPGFHSTVFPSDVLH